MYDWIRAEISNLHTTGIVIYKGDCLELLVSEWIFGRFPPLKETTAPDRKAPQYFSSISIEPGLTKEATLVGLEG
jgi:hypothetical protein